MGNYRNPGGGQMTSLRINALLVAHLADGGDVQVASVTDAAVDLAGRRAALDLSHKAGRLLAENAALIAATAAGDVAVLNLD